MSQEYSRVPTSVDDDDGVPVHVLAAAKNIFRAQRGREAASDDEALSFVQGMLSSSLLAEEASTRSPSAMEASLPVSDAAEASVPPRGDDGVPAPVLAAASRIFAQHHGRPAASSEEALAFARRAMELQSSSSPAGAQQESSLAATATDEPSPLALDTTAEAAVRVQVAAAREATARAAAAMALVAEEDGTTSADEEEPLQRPHGTRSSPSTPSLALCTERSCSCLGSLALGARHMLGCSERYCSAFALIQAFDRQYWSLYATVSAAVGFLPPMPRDVRQ
jgi:hypothetical protein